MSLEGNRKLIVAIVAVAASFGYAWLDPAAGPTLLRDVIFAALAMFGIGNINEHNQKNKTDTVGQLTGIINKLTEKPSVLSSEGETNERKIP